MHRVAAGLLILVMASGPPPVLATHGPSALYAQHSLNSGANGIDGYMRHSGITMHHYQVNAVVDQMSLTRTSPAGFHWVQIGHLQGTGGRGCPGSSNCIQTSSGRMYAENWRSDGSYAIYSLGPVPKPNYAYYIHWNGLSCSSQCLFYFKVGSVLNNPVAYGFLGGSWGLPIVGYESRWNHDVGGREALNNEYFGLDDNQQVNLGYAIRLYLAASDEWRLWTAGTWPSTACVDQGDLSYAAIRYWYAFRVHDDGFTPDCD